MSNNRRISRRDFLELLGAGGTVLFLGWFAGEGSLFSLLFKNKNGNNGGVGSSSSINPQLAYAQSSGSWLPVERSTSTVAIHTALTRTGKIFYLAGSGWDVNN
ncbi:MAG TPA: twin-arginine translocation signal domain-containing protein, partial [Candidatus Nitrosocosmicus sp.]|nr:twin-arginine translocation signal domain-containing protein [Candidatus Nitrosocosmicus sp.]